MNSTSSTESFTRAVGEVRNSAALAHLSMATNKKPCDECYEVKLVCRQCSLCEKWLCAECATSKTSGRDLEHLPPDFRAPWICGCGVCRRLVCRDCYLADNFFFPNELVFGPGVLSRLCVGCNLNIFANRAENESCVQTGVDEYAIDLDVAHH